jgi:hypothetical protein
LTYLNQRSKFLPVRQKTNLKTQDQTYSREQASAGSSGAEASGY